MVYKNYKYTSVLVTREVSDALTKIKHLLEYESIDAVITNLIKNSKYKGHLLIKISDGDGTDGKRKN
jgi:DNA modification methylase